MRRVPPPRKPGQEDQMPPGPGDETPGGGRRPGVPLWYFVVPIIILVLFALNANRPDELTYGELCRELAQNNVTELSIDSSSPAVHGKRRVAGKEDPQDFVSTRPIGEDEELVPLAREKVGTDLEVTTSWLDNPLVYMGIMLLVLIIVWRFMLNRMNPAGGAMEFGQSRARMVAQRDVGVSFEDVAGIPECKQELEEIVEFLRTPEKFTRLGGRIPKGVLLVGPPGTGKTLLAKAVAGEAGVTFFSLSGSDFVEMFVGVGAARVRDLFDQAQKNAPCIIFIDELDALGKARGTGYMGGHDEREQTLNALLVQMDGFTTQKGIIILAATNRPEMLDPALLRPGRFDRQVVVPPPDLKDREQILDVHTRSVALGDAVDLGKVAAMTPGFVGADLANLVNEATLLAARRGKDQVEMVDFEQSLERVVAGLEKRNRLMNEQEKEIVAHHEAGHALVASLLPGTDPVHKVSMIPRGMAALGYTLQRPTEDRYLLRRDELMNRLAVMLGGRTAEEICFDEVSTGAQNDLQRATELAREMVVEFGMSDDLGPVSYGSNGSQRQEVLFGRPYSERTARCIDEAIHKMVEGAHETARTLLADHKDALLAVAERLRVKEVMEAEELREVLHEHGIELAFNTEPAADASEDQEPSPPPPPADAPADSETPSADATEDTPPVA